MVVREKIKIGDIYGKLTVIEKIGKMPNIATNHIYYKVKCICGCEEVTRSSLLRTGKKQMCLNCYRKNSKQYKHGFAGKSRIYKIWLHMKGRCLNKTDNNYYRYGGRGISICKEWKDDFINFYNWAITNGYSSELTIDRINNDGNYEPQNCRWTDIKTQANNRRSNRKITINGETHNVSEWAEILNKTRGYVYFHYC